MLAGPGAWHALAGLARARTPASASRLRPARRCLAAHLDAQTSLPDALDGLPAPLGAAEATAQAVHDEVHDHGKVAMLLSLFRRRSHLVARLDPLGRPQRIGASEGLPGTDGSLLPMHARSRREPLLTEIVDGYDTAWSPDEKSTYLTRVLGLRRAAHAGRVFRDTPLCLTASGQTGAAREAPLHALVDTMVASYCRGLNFQYSHLPSWEQQQWLRRRAEACALPLSRDEKRSVLRRLLRADAFESFLGAKFPASKRFGLEGCEAALPALHMLVEDAAAAGIARVEIGMAHRGRLNVLHNLLRKPLGALCAEMEGHQSDFRVGDVKYHLGQSTRRRVAVGGAGEREVTVTVAPNPSHLEMAMPVVQGLVRSLQRHSDRGSKAAMALLVHGDAAFAGLGVTAEAFQMAALPAYSTGGSVHVVLNNQIGFTTLPAEARSSELATDVATAAGFPVIHANADDAEAVVRAMRAALAWRQAWGRDVVVNVCGYRRFGHNELDDPSTTLPLTYARLAAHPPVKAQYAAQLLADGVVTGDETAAWAAELEREFSREYALAMSGAYKESATQFLESHWQSDALASLARVDHEAFRADRHADRTGTMTGLPLETLQHVGRQLTKVPRGMQLHAEVASVLQRRRDMVAAEDSRVDFAFGELLAFGALSLRRPAQEDNSTAAVSERAALGLNHSHYGIRLTGQDSVRGTFNQRHATVYDVRTRAAAHTLDRVHPRQDRIEVANSPLNEAAALAFEYGHSVGSKDRALVVWEAQFGDFVNNAQVIIDQFVASGEAKWGQQSGLVMLLPHGYDGQGPDHSSARLERFLSLMHDDPDHLPGYSPQQRQQIADTYEAMRAEFGATQLAQRDVEHILRRLGVLGGDGAAAAPGADDACTREVMATLWRELGLGAGGELTAAAWEKFMVQFIRRQAERETNMFVVVPSTPAQYFHALRRQANLPYQKPLVVATPKYLHHHRPATSALEDFTTGTFFNRVIDDGKGSDNTRHLAHSASGHPFLLPAPDIRRVLLCCGQMYYHLSRARRARRINNIVLVRLEQIAPFPHDIVLRIMRQYGNAELCWCQEEPKNQGAWAYVRPRLRTALKQDKQRARFVHLTPARQQTVRYIGRAASATTATAAYWIHAQEQSNIIDEALTL